MIIRFTIIFLLFSCFTKVPLVKNLNINKVNNKKDFLIVKIDSIENIILVYAKRNDSVLKIVSLKRSEKNCTKISVGKKYSLKIKSYFSNNYPQKLDIKGFKVDKTIIKLENNGVIWDLFSSPNIKGLCYVE